MDTSPASPSSTSSASPSVSQPRAGATPAPQQPSTRSRRGWGSRGLRPVTLGIAALVVIVDQFTKWLVINHVNEPIHLFWTLQLVKAYNTGTAFSLGIGLGPFIGLLAVVVVLLLARMGRAVVNPAGVVALGMVMGGAVGNLTDRLLRESHGFMHGAVVDFIDLQWWPVFNVADMAIVIGGFLLAFSGFGEHRVAPGAPSGGAGSGPGTGRPAGGSGQGSSPGRVGAAE